MYSIFTTSVVVRLARIPVSVSPRPAVRPVPVVRARTVATTCPDSTYPYGIPAGDSSDLFVLLRTSDGSEIASARPSIFVVLSPCQFL